MHSSGIHHSKYNEQITSIYDNTDYSHKHTVEPNNEGIYYGSIYIKFKNRQHPIPPTPPAKVVEVRTVVTLRQSREGGI